MGRMWDIAVCLNSRCGERRRVYHREWIRASRPRCLGCGGPIEPSSSASEEHVEHEDIGRTLGKKKPKDGRGHIIS